MDAPAAVFRVADAWRGEWVGPSIFRRGGGTLHYVGPASAAEPTVVELPGVLLPGFCDHHVHLQLLPPTARTALAEGGLSRVIDLGGDPLALSEEPDFDPFGVELDYAGAFLTAPGGYPSDRAWAPVDSWREVASSDDAEAAVFEQKVLGASRIKIALNAVAGPVWDDALLAEVVAEARAAGLPVVAHVEGAGQADRAITVGVDTLAHAPFSERLASNALARAALQGMTMVSTLAIHEGEALEIALDSVRRFHELGGEVRYGTDLGNGDQPLGVNPLELERLELAGLSVDAVLRALVGGFGRGRWKKRVTWMPARPASTRELTTAVSVSVGDLESAGA